MRKFKCADCGSTEHRDIKNNVEPRCEKCFGPLKEINKGANHG